MVNWEAEVRGLEPFQLPNEDDRSASLLTLSTWGEGERITAGFTTRHTGNAALHVGDDPEKVIAHRSAIASALNWKFEAFTCAEQIHGNDVHVVTSDDVGRGRDNRENAIPDTDALVTAESDVLLAMFFADCVPLYFHDPVTGALGLAHAGWKGTVAEIAVRTVEKMTEAFGSDPANISAAIGPAIGSCCYEVDESVLRHIRSLLASPGLPEGATEANPIVQPNVTGERAQLDLKHLNRQLMIKAGIMPSRIEISSWCTSCRADLFFSHRKEKGNTGRMMSWLGKKSR
jgi:YfiH family protein